MVSVSTETDEVKLWDLNKNSCVQTIKAHQSSIYSITKLSDNIIASGSSDLTIKKWDIISSNCIETLNGHDNYIDCLIKLYDGRLASASGDKTIKIWNN